MKIHNLILGAFFLFIIAGNIQAASFDCGKAASEVEKIICGNDELSRLDESLHKAYLQALKRADIKEQTMESQKQWLKNERNACRDAECLKTAYQTRIKELGLSSYGIDPTPAAGIGSKAKKCWVQTKTQDNYFEDPELCAAFEQVLNATCEPPEKLQCNWTLPKGETGFTKIQWQPIDYRKHWLLIKDLRLSGWAKQYRDENWVRLKPVIRKQFERGYISLEAANVDIDGDGNEEYIVRST